MTEKKEIRVYKLRFIVFMLLFTCLLFFFLMLMRRTFSSYVSDANIEITSNYAAYIFETERLNFNLETDGIIPSDNPYVHLLSYRLKRYDYTLVDAQFQYKIQEFNSHFKKDFFRIYAFCVSDA